MPSTVTEDVHEVRPTLTDHNDIVDMSQETNPITPEDGHRWTVIFACFLISFWSVGTVYSWGVVQAALLKNGLSSPSTLSWIGSLAFTCIALLAIINARVIALLDARLTAYIGLSLLSMGQILSGFLIEHVSGLFISAGIISGIGIRYVW